MGQVGDSALMTCRVGIPCFNGNGNGLDGRSQSLSHLFSRLFAVRDVAHMLSNHDDMVIIVKYWISVYFHK